MGDMADWIIENGLCDDEEPLYDYGGAKACRNCGEGGLHWENLGTRGLPQWVLCKESGQMHDCKVRPYNA